MRRFAAAMLAVVLSLAGGAHAQNATTNGMDCVYTALIPDYEAVAEAFLASDLTEAETAEIDELIGIAKSDCAARFAYAHGQLEAVAELGVYGATVDYLSDELLFNGVSEAAVNGILDAYDTFTDEDVDILYGGDWRDDAAFLAKMKAQMTSAGIPDGDNMEIAFVILEIAVLMEEANFLFMLDQAVEDSQAKRAAP